MERSNVERSEIWIVRSLNECGKQNALGIVEGTVHLVNSETSGIGERKTLCGNDMSREFLKRHAVDSHFTPSGIRQFIDTNSMCPECMLAKQEQDIRREFFLNERPIRLGAGHVLTPANRVPG